MTFHKHKGKARQGRVSHSANKSKHQFDRKKVAGKGIKKSKPPRMVEAINKITQLPERIAFPRELDELHRLLDRKRCGEIDFNPIPVIRGYWMRTHKVFKMFAPLKIGVHNELLKEATLEDGSAPDFHLFRAALQLHTTSPRYLAAILACKQRRGLDGKPLESLTIEEKDYAAEKLQEQLEIIAAKSDKKKTNRTVLLALDNYRKWREKQK